MRDVRCETITETVARLCIEAATILPPQLAILLECAAEGEISPEGTSALEDIVENFKYAAENKLPICQDTGMAVVFADIGQEVHIEGGLFEDAVNEGVRIGYKEGLLRMSIVGDPLRRINTEDNTPCVLHVKLTAGDKINIHVAPKGFGSENKSAMRVFLPSATPADIEDFIVSTVREAGADPCPPVVLGVGLGGTIEQSALIAKRALIRPMDTRNSDIYYAKMEKRVLNKINSLGIGPQGFGGRNTAIAVNIEAYPTHIAGLPCVVNVGCHATRHAHAEI